MHETALLLLSQLVQALQVMLQKAKAYEALLVIYFLGSSLHMLSFPYCLRRVFFLLRVFTCFVK